MRLNFLSVAILILSAGATAEDKDGFLPLFNGKDLTGWKVVNTAPSTWSFNDEGYLVCSGIPVGEIRTERMYQNFILELEWRHLVPKGNAGVFVWADDISSRGQPFIKGVEVQVLENAYGDTKSHTTHGDIFPIHGAAMTPINGRGGQRAFPIENRSKPSPEWNHYRIECIDGNISLAVNGKVVTRGTDCSPRMGYLCLESEGGVVHWRNVRIKELSKSLISPEQVATSDRGFRCLYSGVDFSGWHTAAGWKSRDWELISEAGADPLLTKENFKGDIGFIVDVKFKENSGAPHLTVKGKSIAIDPRNPLLEKTGSYNRIEGFVRGELLTLEINGREAGAFTGIPDEGPLGMNSDGPAEWANPYVRAL